MNRLTLALSFAYTMACVYLPCLLYQLVLYRRWAHHGKIAKGNLLWRCIFILYLCMVMRAVGMGSIWDIGRYDPLIRWDQINLMPFRSAGVMTYLLNIVLFAPLGFLLPLLWRRYRALAHQRTHKEVKQETT